MNNQTASAIWSCIFAATRDNGLCAALAVLRIHAIEMLNSPNVA